MAYFKEASQARRERDLNSVFYKHSVELCSCTNLPSTKPEVRAEVQLLKYR